MSCSQIADKAYLGLEMGFVSDLIPYTQVYGILYLENHRQSVEL